TLPGRLINPAARPAKRKTSSTTPTRLSRLPLKPRLSVSHGYHSNRLSVSHGYHPDRLSRLPPRPSLTVTTPTVSHGYHPDRLSRLPPRPSLTVTTPTVSH
ncbi:hypothetical protein NHX12_026729, partial [Muraenolepis orangiensis]